MRIDDDDRKIGRQKRMDLIRRIQDQQQQSDKPAGAGAKDEVKNAEKKSELQATEVTVELQRAAVQQDQQKGVERAAEAVEAAHHQQTRGEDWKKFRTAEATELPPSVEEKARAEKARLEEEDAKRVDNERLSVRELQNELAVKNRMIKS
ncbi:MAG: hypothetical protein HY903_10130 [Deltaproteobacteria bacterium]|nr:hypothetical protein [Deltaproteobacteria bacterium]